MPIYQAKQFTWEKLWSLIEEDKVNSEQKTEKYSFNWTRKSCYEVKIILVITTKRIRFSC